MIQKLEIMLAAIYAAAALSSCAGGLNYSRRAAAQMFDVNQASIGASATVGGEKPRRYIREIREEPYSEKPSDTPDLELDQQLRVSEAEYLVELNRVVSGGGRKPSFVKETDEQLDIWSRLSCEVLEQSLDLGIVDPRVEARCSYMGYARNRTVGKR